VCYFVLLNQYWEIVTVPVFSRVNRWPAELYRYYKATWNHTLWYMVTVWYGTWWYSCGTIGLWYQRLRYHNFCGTKPSLREKKSVGEFVQTRLDFSLPKIRRKSLHLVYVCDSLRISVVLSWFSSHASYLDAVINSTVQTLFFGSQTP